MRTLVLLLLCVTTAACVSTRARHGYVVERGEETLDAQVGIDTRESVLARYGEPSVRPALTDDVWYYVSASTNSRAFYETETTAREVVAFAFDQEGRVADVVTYGLEDGKPVDIVSRVTPTRGKELSFLEQLIGGVGQLPGLPQGQGPGAPGNPGGQ
jgi:outer membrane protein assembly factor BamE (lipoprotein component of BamABCDE complex)